MNAGYSTRSLAEKLGVKAGMVVLIVNGAESLLSQLPYGIEPKLSRTVPKPGSKLFDYIHLFTTQEASLAQSLPQLKAQLEQNGMIWISWPKRSAMKLANMYSDLSEDLIRDHALSVGLVDVKVCAVDETWSGLKLVIPLKLREKK
jgi:hypothetical protein